MLARTTNGEVGLISRRCGGPIDFVLLRLSIDCKLAISQYSIRTFEL